MISAPKQIFKSTYAFNLVLQDKDTILMNEKSNTFYFWFLKVIFQQELF